VLLIHTAARFLGDGQAIRLQSPIEVLVRTPNHFLSLFVCGALALTLAHCSADAPTTPAVAPTFSLSSVGAQHDLLACPGGSDDDVATKVIGPKGGKIKLGGFVMRVPAGAVPETTTFVMRVPQAQVLKVKIRARGEQHYTFLAPVQITLDYSRCSAVPSDPTAWYVDENSDAELEQMPGINNSNAQTFTLQTGHLSGYALAN
jgi:hypothetical protein